MISVVIVHWNTPDLLRNCLASILETAPDSLTNTIVVDCDSHGCGIDGLIAQFEGVRLIQMPRNDGYAAGCNAGFDALKTNTILFINADTELQPGAVAALRECFELNSRIGLVAPLLLNPDRSLQSSGYTFPGFANVICDLLPIPNRIRGSTLNGQVDAGNLGLPYAVDYALGAAIAVRTAALKEIGGWDENYGMYSEEVDLARRLDQAGWRRLIEPKAQVVHVGGASTSQRATAMQAALWRSRGLYHHRWSGRGKRLALRALVNVASHLSQKRGEGKLIRDAFAAGLRQ